MSLLYGRLSLSFCEFARPGFRKLDYIQSAAKLLRFIKCLGRKEIPHEELLVKIFSDDIENLIELLHILLPELICEVKVGGKLVKRFAEIVDVGPGLERRIEEDQLNARDASRIRKLRDWRLDNFCWEISKEEFKDAILFSRLYDDERAMVDKQLELLLFLLPHWISEAEINDKRIIRIKKEENEEVETQLQLAMRSIRPPQSRGSDEVYQFLFALRRWFVKNEGNCFCCRNKLYNDTCKEVIEYPCKHRFHERCTEESDTVHCPLCADTHKNRKKHKKPRMKM